ncbi:dienelactone hydrolase [Coleophoma cylindrospora]|uniref:Dienelactone hydrolase n=1 Tax=Coleophoma cylindrospora TaxID=1849047 RepID=A0A3D8QNK0_9HELO|nr:dienelactone hydrolase [Coleophoma cylindrospora]
MEPIPGYSRACCMIPPIVAKEYQEKGKYETIGGLKIYVTGPPSATKALLIGYDIWGLSSQVIQGADILATSDKDHSYQVFIPDFFEGEPCNKAWYPPNTDEQKKNLYAWFDTRTPAIGAERTPKIIKDVEALYGKKTWGVVGFCWGGKFVSLLSGPDSLFKAAAQGHPALLDPADAKKITIPTCVLPSTGESVEEMDKWENALKVEKYVKRFEQGHGWMSAKGNLEDEKCREDFENGYRIFLAWFAKHL